MNYGKDRQNNAASSTETESTAINDNPTVHTAEENANIEKYKASVDESIKEVFEEYYKDPNKGFSRHNISTVTDKQSSDIASIIGGDYSGYRNAINSNGIKHILNEHGPNGTVNHSMGDLNDIARIGYILDNYDSVEQATYSSGEPRFSDEFRDSKNRPAPMVVFSKKVDGTYYVIEAVPDTKDKKLWVVSAYMDKKGGITQAPNAQGPGNTSNTSLASLPQGDLLPTTSIPSTGPVVNTQTGSNMPGQELLDYPNSKQGQQTATAQRAGSELLNYGKDGQNNTASQGAETVHVVERLKENIPQLSEMPSVASTNSYEIYAAPGRNIAEKARALFERIKGVVARPGFGDVEINTRSVKDDLSHGVGVAKASVIPSIPNVIKKGTQIDFQENWKGRPYDGYVFAAPVELDGKVVYVAAVVKQTSKNRFYLHEVVDSEGNIIKIKGGETANPTSLASVDDAGAISPLNTPEPKSAGGEAVASPTSSIPSTPQNVNTQTGSNMPGQELLDYVNSQQGQQTTTAQSAGSELLNYGKDRQNNTASTTETDVRPNTKIIEDSRVCKRPDRRCQQRRYR